MRIAADAISVSQISPYIARHASSDYQEYLSHYDKGFPAYRVEHFFQGTQNTYFALPHPESFSALAKVVVLPWDTECFGFRVAKIEALFEEHLVTTMTLLEEITAYALHQNIKLLTCRIAYNNFDLLHALETVGFRTVDAMNIFLWDNQQRTREEFSRPQGSGHVTITSISKEDHDVRQALRKIASSVFRHSRLNRDPHFSSAQRTSFYDQLLNSFLQKDDLTGLMAQIRDVPVGFVLGAKDQELSHYLEESLGLLWLIGVDDKFTGRGVGQALLKEFLSTLSRQVRYIEVGTQINNYPALNLYASAGLKCVSSVVTLHRWLS